MRYEPENDERDVFHHIHEAEQAYVHLPNAGHTQTVFHVGCAIAFAILEVARALKAKNGNGNGEGGK